jgi:zinc protease
MNLSRLACALGLLGAVSAMTAAAPPTPPAVAPIRFQSRTLQNGLRVLTSENHATPRVAVYVVYHVGSKDDPPGRSGFAHLFEHLMFKATKNMPAETLDRLTEDVGGENNAYTADDVTVYHETIPSNHLDRLLWAEAERMANLTVDPTTFVSERDVVKEEYRQSYTVQPYARLNLLIDQKSWTKHPYQRPGIGNIAELNAATIDDVRAFHKTFYRPDNATLVVVGDFDPATIDARVDRVFARIDRPSGPIPRVTIIEPARTAERRYAETNPGVPLPALALTFRIPKASDKDIAAISILDTLLSTGESSRLYRALVYTQQVASEIATYTDAREDAGLFIVRATAASGKTLDTLEKATLAELARVATAPPSPAELQKAKNQLLTGQLKARETSDGRANALGQAAVIQGDANRVNRDLADLQAVTAADVQRVARTYLAAKNRVTIRFSDGPATVATPLPAPTLPTEPPAVPTTPEDAPPPPAAPRALVVPKATERRLPNGLRVVIVPRTGSGLVTARLVIPDAGAAQESNAQAGLAQITAALLTQGTKTRSAAQLAEAAESLGGSLDTAAEWDGASLGISVRAGVLAPALAILGDIAANPTFRPAELTRLRTQTLDQLAIDRKNPGVIAGQVAARVLFGEGAYGQPASGTPETLKRLVRADLVTFHQARYRPEQATLILAGDVAPETGFAVAKAAFGNWKAIRSGASPAAARAVTPAARRRIVVIDQPGSGQAVVRIAVPGIVRRDASYAQGQVVNAVLGGGFSSRLNQEIRIKRGLSYGAGSRLDARASAGLLTASAQTKNETAGEVAELLLAELTRLGTGDLPDTELTARRSTLLGDFARPLDTGSGLAAALSRLTLVGLPFSELGRYATEIERADPSTLQAWSRRHLAAENASVVVVGDARAFLDDLARRLEIERAAIEVVPLAQLDLNRASLRRR